MAEYRRIAAVTTACKILEFLSSQSKPSAVADIAKAVGVPKETTLCHLATLEDENFVQKAGGFYELGMGAAMLYARKKASLERDRNRAQEDMDRLENM